MIKWLKRKIKQHYCYHDQEYLLYKKQYVDYIGNMVFVYECEKCGKTVRKLVRYKS